MADLFQKRKLLYAVLAGVFVLVIIILALNIQDRKPQKSSTPDLIQLAFAKGEITEEERLLYLAYALGDSEKLPAQFHNNNYPWSGTFVIMDLHETVTSKSVMCKLSPFAQIELRRILHVGVICD